MSKIIHSCKYGINTAYLHGKSFHSSSALLRYDSIQMSFNEFNSPGTDANKFPLIIMHGLFGSKNNWNSISKVLNLQLKKKILTVDARNHGDSKHTNEFSYPHLMTDITRFYDDLKLPKASVMGHSMGGRAVILFALHYPEKIEKLVVVDISPFMTKNKQMFSMKKYFDALKSINLSKDLPLSEGRKQAKQQLSKWIKDEGVLQFLLTNLVKQQNGTFGWKVNINVLSDKFDNEIVRFHLDSNLICEKPTLFIAGTKADYIAPSDESKILKIFPAAKFVYLDCGHWVHAEKPNEFVALVKDFINSS